MKTVANDSDYTSNKLKTVRNTFESSLVKIHNLKKMKSKVQLILLITILFSIQIGYAQSTENHHKVYIPFWIGAGYGYEWSVADEVTINAQIDMRVYIGDDDFAIDNFVFSPRLTIEPRYYYNLKKRAEQGKSIQLNSANYVSLDMSFELDAGFGGIRDWPQNTLRILPTWGLRRELAEHFTIDFGVYAGYKLKEIGDRNWDTGKWDSDYWTTHKFAWGINLAFSHIF